MAERKQHRRTVSVTKSTYDKIRAYCELYDVSMSSFVEARVLDHLDAQPENLIGNPAEVAGGRP